MSSGPEPDSEPRDGFDIISAVLALFVMTALTGFVWLRYGPAGAPNRRASASRCRR